ncbi:MAG TPA: ABC transporter permease [Vicinamibacterales bacterium]|nr:ABC transporter permease [Vicinamibacterales bacterium]
MWHDVRFIGRSFRKQRGLAVGALLVLAAGLGFNTAAFSILNTLLFRPYPYPQLGELVIVRDRRLAEGAHQGNPIASGDFVELRRDNRVFTRIAAFHARPLLLTGSGEPERIEGVAASASFFDTLGVRTVAGRTFGPGEDEPGQDDRVVLSHRYWKARFGADPALVGRTITLNGRSTTVVGVIPDDNCYPPGVDAWVPLVLTPAEQQDHASQHFLAMARLKPGVSLSTAHEDVRQLATRLATRYPETNRDRGFDLLELRKEQYEFTEGLFLMLQVAAFLVLGLAAANVINLMLAQIIDRQRELTIRLALGASRRMVFNLLVIEALIVSFAGGAAGGLVAFWSMPLIHAALPEGIGRWIAGWQSIRIDRTVAMVTALTTVLTGTVLGCVTGWQATHAAASGSLRDTGRSGSPRLTRARRVLIVSEVAFAMVLLLGAVVTLKGFSRLSAAFDTLIPRELLNFGVTLPASRYPDDQHVVDFQDRLVERIGALPGVSQVGLIRNEPASNVSNPLITFTIEGRAPLALNDAPRADLQTMSWGGFEAVRVRVLRGRALERSDTSLTPRVAVISEAMARRFWPMTDPVGVRLRLGDSTTPWITVVGVVTDLRLNWYDPEPRPTIVVPHSQVPSRQMRVMVRASVDPVTLVGPIRAVVSRLDPLQPVSGMQRVDDVVAESISPVRVLGLLLLIGGGLAVVFSAMGIYGALAHWVSAQRREFGIRIALGASGTAVGQLVLKQVLTLTVIGLGIGLPLGFMGLALLRSRLFGLAAVDPATVGQVMIFVLAVATLAAVVPARRARRTDPSTLLQSE